MKTTAFLLTMLLPAAAVAQQEPTTGYAPVNGLKMYYEVHGSGVPVVLLHGAFMTITNNWTGWIGELSKTRKVIAVEMQGHGRTADIDRDLTSENLADDAEARGERGGTRGEREPRETRRVVVATASRGRRVRIHRDTSQRVSRWLR